ncbi:hypothetical protein CsSME_00029127 [Camellia sinensis var. sinensis]
MTSSRLPKSDPEHPITSLSTVYCTSAVSPGHIYGASIQRKQLM